VLDALRTVFCASIILRRTGQGGTLGHWFCRAMQGGKRGKTRALEIYWLWDLIVASPHERYSYRTYEATWPSLQGTVDNGIRADLLITSTTSDQTLYDAA
jgi:hypothetical protein